MSTDPTTKTAEALDISQDSSLRELEFNALNRLDLLQGVTAESVYGLLQRCPVETLREGELLLRAGRKNRQVYAILSGSLSVTLEDVHGESIAHLGPGETVGEISALDQEPATANVRAVTDSRLLVVDLPTLWSLIGASHAFALNLILKLVERVRGSNAAMHEIARLRAQFEQAALFDSLTGVANRRWLNQNLPRLVLRHERAGDPLSVAIIDIDHFKQFNDKYGHPSGDRVLTWVARTLSSRLRPTDLLARIGGEEFVAILPNTDVDGARVATERLRAAIAALKTHAPDGTELPRVTISLGIAQARPGQSAAELTAAADAALYRAKDAGRDRCSL